MGSERWGQTEFSERWGQTEFQVNLKLGLTPCPACPRVPSRSDPVPSKKAFDGAFEKLVRGLKVNYGPGEPPGTT